MRIVHGSVLSPYVRKVLIALEYKGLSYEIKSVNPFIKSPLLFELNPLGKIPVYQEGEFKLPDSKVICAYLEKQFPDQSIYPSAAQDYGLALWYQEYVHEKIAPEIIKLAFNLVVAPKYLNIPGDSAKILAARKSLPEGLNYFENIIADQQYLVAQQFTIADISLFSFLIHLRFIGEPLDAQIYPKLTHYLAGIEAEPSVVRVLEQLKQRLK